MGFLLKRDGWKDAEASCLTSAAIVLDLRAAGFRGIYSSLQMTLEEIEGGHQVDCMPAFLSDPMFTQSLDPYSRECRPASMAFSLMAEYFPVEDVINSGQSLIALTAKVYFILVGTFALDQAFLLVDGKVDNFAYDHNMNTVNFAVVDDQLSGDRRFPPHVITVESFPTAPAESFGKCYPVVIGTVKKVPAVDISSNRGVFLAMDDVMNQFSGTYVDDTYDEDTALIIASQAQDSDSEGNYFWKVTLQGGSESDSADVSLDITGPSGTLIDAIIFLLLGYSDKSDFFDLTSLRHLNREFNIVTLSVAFNDIVDGGVLQVIRERFIKELPIAIVQRGKKFYFQSMLWDRDVRKVLSFEKNIIQMVSPPTETSRDRLSNSFVVECGMSGLRGDALTANSRNKDNDAFCQQSFKRYGELGRRTISIPDVADEEGAMWLMNWIVDTYSKTRIRISYFCTFDTVDVNLWDTVQVLDSYLHWDHGPLFKVVGITLGASNGITLELLSVDDYFEVYHVNRRVYSPLELIGAQVVI